MNIRSDIRMLEEIADPDTAKSVSDIFYALSDPTRLRILQALSVGPLCVCDLAAVTDVSQSAVSHQLRMLRALDLVGFQREGRHALYRLADDHVRALLTQGKEHALERTGLRDATTSHETGDGRG